MAKPRKSPKENKKPPQGNKPTECQKEMHHVFHQGSKVIGGVLVLIVGAVLVFSIAFDILPLAIFRTLYASVESILNAFATAVYTLIYLAE